MPNARAITRRAFAVFFTAGGLAHFLAADAFVNIVPPWLPFKGAIVLATGAIELVFAAFLAAPFGRYTRIAGYLLALYCLAVLPANVHMALDPALSLGLPTPLLWLRVVLQFPLIAAIIWATSDGTGTPSGPTAANVGRRQDKQPTSDADKTT